MGEGELNFMPHEFKEQNYCIVCTKIAVDDKYKSTQKVPTITQGEIFEYLSEREDNIEVSYLKRIYHVDDPAELKRYFDENGEKIVDDNNYEVNEMNSNIDFNKQTYAIIIQQIPEGDATEKFAGLFSGGLTTFSIIGIAAKTVGIAFLGVSGIGFAVVGGVIVGTYVYTQSGVNEQYQYAAPAVVPYNAQTLKALKCTDLEGAA